MKKILLISICFVLFCTGIIYAKDINEVILNGKTINFSVEPIIENETTIVPMREICEMLGARVIWNNEDKTIFAVKDNINIWLQLGNTIGKINNKEFDLTVAPKFINGRTLVPLKFITETFGGNVVWDDDSKKIIITTIKMPKMIWPVPKYTKISKDFGMQYNTVLKKEKMSTGISIPAPKGTSIVAVADGKVIVSGELGGYGNVMIIDHGEGIVTVYAHCSELLIETNRQVKQGDEVARIGSTGNATGPCLYFELRINGIYTDPKNYVKPIEE